MVCSKPAAFRGREGVHRCARVFDAANTRAIYLGDGPRKLENIDEFIQVFHKFR